MIIPKKELMISSFLFHFIFQQIIFNRKRAMNYFKCDKFGTYNKSKH